MRAGRTGLLILITVMVAIVGMIVLGGGPAELPVAQHAPAPDDSPLVLRHDPPAAGRQPPRSENRSKREPVSLTRESVAPAARLDDSRGSVHGLDQASERARSKSPKQEPQRWQPTSPATPAPLTDPLADQLTTTTTPGVPPQMGSQTRQTPQLGPSPHQLAPQSPPHSSSRPPWTEPIGSQSIHGNFPHEHPLDQSAVGILNPNSLLPDPNFEPMLTTRDLRLKRSLPDRSADSDEKTYHRIVDGDTLESLALHYYGSREPARQIFEANQAELLQPDVLPLGVNIVIPVLNRVTPPADTTADTTVANDGLVPVPSTSAEPSRVTHPNDSGSQLVPVPDDPLDQPSHK